MQQPDVLIEDHGTIVTFHPLTQRARAWFDEFVQAEPWQWLGQRLSVDHRMAMPLIEGIGNNLAMRIA